MVKDEYESFKLCPYSSMTLMIQMTVFKNIIICLIQIMIPSRSSFFAPCFTPMQIQCAVSTGIVYQSGAYTVPATTPIGTPVSIEAGVPCFGLEALVDDCKGAFECHLYQDSGQSAS